MVEPTIDPERLATLLDGKLGQAEQAELLARLASAEEALEAYADALAIVAELEPTRRAGATDARGTTHRPDRWRLPRWRWVAIAAVLAGVAVAPWLWTRVRPADGEDPGRFVSSLGASAAQLPPQWYGTPWPGMRGRGQPLTATARAARLGARLMDLELAVRARDTTVDELTAEIVDLLEGLPAATPVAAMYRDLGRRASAGAAVRELEPLLARGRVAATKLAGADVFQLAAWAETGRVAAAQRNSDFFRARESRSMLERAPGLASLPEPARAVVQRLQSGLPSEGPRDWGAVQRDLTELLQVLGT